MANERIKKDYHPSFGSNLKKFMDAYGVTSTELAEYLEIGNYPHQIIGSWKAGKREPSFVQLCKIADFLGTSTDALLGRSSPPPMNELTRFLINNKVSEEDQAKIIRVISAVLEL